MSTVVRAGLYQRLTADLDLAALLATNASIYHAQAPASAAFPYIVFHKQAGTPTYTFQTGGAAFDNEVWLVKGIDRNTSSNTVDAIANRLDEVLTDGNITVSGKEVMYLKRESDVEYLETVEGVQYRHAGAFYRLIYQTSS